MIKRPDHFTIVTDQLEATRAFYVDLLGMREGPRPAFPVPGLWLYANDLPVLHVVAVERMPTPRRGALDHMAYWAEGLADTVASLRSHEVSLRLIRAPGANRTWQLFFNDPNGVEVELDFAETETPPEDWKTLSGRLR
ncbi:MAG: VOC family protein [Hydrogenophaga sp.]|uniref:VOC family protein n=1 Tax=Hydrogenophaga sp. TaxID=1904254 RepID=UPI002ABB4C08|nr:VOC family protein [Hydrogenophaga sp.]MDZ4101491.1 VOC family protein [Hydrogenophaga sp.]